MVSTHNKETREGLLYLRRTRHVLVLSAVSRSYLTQQSVTHKRHAHQHAERNTIANEHQLNIMLTWKLTERKTELTAVLNDKGLVSVKSVESLLYIHST